MQGAFFLFINKPTTYKMKLIYTFLFATLLFCSCKKEDYTCTCVDGTGIYPTQNITVSERTQDKAVSACTDKQTDLNKSGSNYNCSLKP